MSRWRRWLLRNAGRAALPLALLWVVAVPGAPGGAWADAEMAMEMEMEMADVDAVAATRARGTGNDAAALPTLVVFEPRQ